MRMRSHAALTATVLFGAQALAQDGPLPAWEFAPDYHVVADTDQDGAVDYHEHSVYLRESFAIAGDGGSEAVYFTHGMAAFAAADGDGDGALTQEEIVAAAQRADAAGGADWAGFVAEADSNRDGAVDALEYHALLSKTLGDADGDGNGQIDQAELASANWMMLEPASGAVTDRYNAGMTDFFDADTDGDGKLSGVEVTIWSKRW